MYFCRLIRTLKIDRTVENGSIIFGALHGVTSTSNTLVQSSPLTSLTRNSQYGLGYGTVSVIFVGNALGYIIAAMVLDRIQRRLGQARSLMAGLLMIGTAYIPMTLASSPATTNIPFPVIVLSFFFVGFASSVNLAVGNVFCASLARGTTALGIMHGAYGIGGTVGPIIATTLITVARVGWGQFYFITMGLAVFNAAFSGWAFWGYNGARVDPHDSVPELERTREEEAEKTGRAPSVPGRQDTREEEAAKTGGVPSVPGHEGTGLEGEEGAVEAGCIPGRAGMFMSRTNRVVITGSVFIMAYQGAEVSISGWVMSFLLDSGRAAGHGGGVGYVSSGFWAGITLGRFLLSAPAHHIGEERFVYGAAAGAVAFQLLAWLVPNLVGNAVAVAVVGFLLGPVYPCAAAVFMRCMSRDEQVRGMGVISAFGSVGGALVPFTTGLLADGVGTFVLHPVAIVLFGVMVVFWRGLLWWVNRAR